MSDTPQTPEQTPQPEEAAPQPPAADTTPPTPDAPQPSEPTPAVAPVTAADAPQPATQPAPAQPSRAGGPIWGTGRRKSSVARVRVLPGSGKILINNREVDTYFSEDKDRKAVVAPLEAVGKTSAWDVLVNVRGGGASGQAGAVRMGLARALATIDESWEPTLRDAGYLTRDARRVERKKYGRRKARRSFQFSKR